MHEFSLMNSLMNQIYQIADQQKARKVKKVKVWLGALSHMSAEHFKEHFDEAAVGGIAQNAVLDVTVDTDESSDNAAHILLQSIEVEI
jgi:hydrogenase nickel incorporation protein HypA/HybF